MLVVNETVPDLFVTNNTCNCPFWLIFALVSLIKVLFSGNEGRGS